MIIALCVPLLVVGLSRATGNPDTTRQSASLDRGVVASIPVAVFAPDMNESFLNRICAETEAIWRTAGLAFTWHRVTSTAAARTSQLVVTIDHHRKDVPGGRAALGWIMFTADGPDPSIHLSLASAEDLLLRTPGVGDTAIVTHEILIGRALGRALSHELGHYLLKSKTHTTHGLMRAIWSSDEFFAIQRSGLELTPKEREAAVEQVQQDKLTEGHP